MAREIFQEIVKPMTESMTHDEVVEAARLWLTRPSQIRPHCSLVLCELVTQEFEQPDAIGWGEGKSVLVECKASVSDFKADAKKNFRLHPDMGMGQIRYYMAPAGVIPVESLPEKWGLAEVKNGRVRVRKKHNGVFRKYNYQAEMTLLTSLYRRLDVKPGRHVSIRSYTIETTTYPKASVTEVVPMRNWIKQIRDLDYGVTWSDEHNDIMFRLRNGKHAGYRQLLTVSDLQACQTPGGPYPPEPDMQTALTDTHLYVTDPSRNEFRVIELH